MTKDFEFSGVHDDLHGPILSRCSGNCTMPTHVL